MYLFLEISLFTKITERKYKCMDDSIILQKAKEIIENLESIEGKENKINYLVSQIYLIMLISMQDK